MPALRAKTPEDRKLLEMIDPIAESLGLEIVRVRLMGGTLRRRLQIMAERAVDNDIAVQECARLSRAVSEVLGMPLIRSPANICWRCPRPASTAR